jgi:hypothetical protein
VTRREDFESLRKLVEGMAPRPEQASALRLFEFYDDVVRTLKYYGQLDTGWSAMHAKPARDLLATLDEEIESV